MSEGAMTGNEQLRTDILVSFEESIRNVHEYANAMQGLDSSIGNLENRLDSMKASMSAFNKTATMGSNNQLRADLERQVEAAIRAKGVVVESLGTEKIHIKGETMSKMMESVERQVNKQVAQMARNINFQLDPTTSKGATLGNDVFAKLNKDVARLVRTQVSNMVDTVKAEGGNMISAESLEGMKLDIGKSTVRAIMSKVKAEIIPILMNPDVPVEGMSFNFTAKDFEALSRKIKAKIKAAMDVDLSGLDKVQASAPNDLVIRLTRQVDKVLARYVAGLSSQLNGINLADVQVPIQNVSKSLRKYIARDMNVTVQQLESTFASLSLGETQAYEVKRQFERLDKVMNRKINGGLKAEIDELVKQVNSVNITPSEKLQFHVINQMNKLNNAIVKKVREQVDIQVNALLADIEKSSATPKPLNRGRKINTATGQAARAATNVRGGSTQQPLPAPYHARPQYNNTGTFGTDRFAQRDQHMNRFGLSGALTNTFRHVIAGGLIGLPMMKLYQSMETYQNNNMENMKMFNNLLFKQEYEQKNEDGTVSMDFTQVQKSVDALRPHIQGYAQLYGQDYSDMYQIAGIGSRTLENEYEIRKFMDLVGQASIMDGEGDPVSVIAPGLESIMKQFKMSVAEMDTVIKAMAVTANKTNATTEDIINGLQKSAAVFQQAGVSAELATMLTGTTVQYSGQSGSSVGNFYTTFLARMKSEDSVDKLRQMGIETYEKDRFGRNVARDTDDIIMELAHGYGDLDDDKFKEELIQALFGKRQMGKGIPALENFDKIMESVSKYESFTDEDFKKMMANNTQTAAVVQERAGVAIDVALTSAIEELTPEITKVAGVVADLAGNISANSHLVADLIKSLASIGIGYMTFKGMKSFAQNSSMARESQNYIRRTNLLGQSGEYGMPGWLSKLTGVEKVNVKQFNKTGSLSALAGLINPELLNMGGMNAKMFDAAFRNTDLAPYMQKLAGMDADGIANMKQYINHNKQLPVNNIADLLYAMEQSQGWRAPKALTPAEMQGRANAHINNRGMANLMGEEFSKSLLAGIKDTESFTQMTNKNPMFGNVLGSLANMDDASFAAFTQHAQSMMGGQSINDIETLDKVMTSFNQTQVAQNQNIRKASPLYKQWNKAITGISEKLNGSAFGRGLKNLTGSLSNIPSLAKGAVAGLAAMGLQIVAFAGQMLLMQSLGEGVQKVAYNLTASDEQKNLDTAQFEYDALTKNSRNAFKTYNEGGWGTKTWMNLKLGWDGMVDFLNGSGNDKFDSADMITQLMDMQAFIKENYSGLDGYSDEMLDHGYLYRNQGGAEGYSKDMQATLESVGKSIDDLVYDMATSGGDNSLASKLENAKWENYQKEAEKTRQETAFHEAMEESRRRAEAARLADGDDLTFADISPEQMKSRINEAMEGINAQATLAQYTALLEGHTSDSEQYFQARRTQVEEMKEVYKQELDLVDKVISDLEQTIADFTPEERWKTDAETGEFVLDESGNKIDSDLYTNTVKKLEVAQARSEDDYKEIRADLAKTELMGRQLDYDWYVKRAMNEVSKASQDSTLENALNAVKYDRQSDDYFDATKDALAEELRLMREQLAVMQAVELTGDIGENQQKQIKALQTAIAGKELALKDNAISSMAAGRSELAEFEDEQSLEYLKAKYLAGGNDESPMLRALRLQQAQAFTREIEGQIGELQDQLASTSDAEVKDRIQDEIRDLQKQQLSTQIAMLDEMKGATGTFNMPDGAHVMTYYEHMTRNNSHQSYTVQGGDVQVSITLPNVNGETSTAQLERIGRSIGQGLYDSNVGNLRQQMLANN